MTDVQKELDRAFRLLSNIGVSGDGVELMAEAKELLRRAHKLAGPEKKEEQHGG